MDSEEDRRTKWQGARVRRVSESISRAEKQFGALSAPSTVYASCECAERTVGDEGGVGARTFLVSERLALVQL